MTGKAMSPEGAPRSKRGRKLGPITAGTGRAHRAWLEPLRGSYQASGLTIGQLERETGWSRSKISELLRAAGRYPRWEFTRSLLTALHWPASSMADMRALWALAAREANKRTIWINSCLQGDGLSADDRLPVHFSAFQDLYRDAYTGYAHTFLRRRAEARRAVGDVFILLLFLWDEALASDNPERFAWQILRQTVMERTPHPDNSPALVEAAFDTLALRTAADPVAQIEESMFLFDGLRRLPAGQLDVMVLLHLRGLDETAVAAVLGVPLAAVRSTARHARRHLDGRLRTATQEGHPGDRSD
ncbi:helix-turn-helix domain-containing protein [Streptomyces sp. RK9]|uniref:helix-turn-helix domain-containing protein n=1 Tax=Streptomyces sp. RK9 TaxID=3239284 RepID=UPI00386D7844